MMEQRVAIYARYSSTLQDERSIEDQIRLCREYAAKQDWRVLDEWVCADRAKSGQTTVGREGFRQILNGARQRPRPFEIVLVEQLDRSSRESEVAIATFKDLKALGVRLVGVSDGMDSDREGAELDVSLRAIIANQYVRDLAKKTHRGLEGQFIRGFHAGGHLFGLRSEPQFDDARPGLRGERRIAGYVLRIHEEEANIIRRIFTLYAESGVAVDRIVAMLNADGVPWPGQSTGHRSRQQGWAHSSVIAILDDPKYAGHLVWNRSKWTRDRASGRRRSERRPEHEQTHREAPALAIVSQATWDAAQNRRREAKARHPRFGGCVAGAGTVRAPIKHLLSGLLRCAVCCSSITVIGGKGANRTYGCLNARKKGRAFCSNRLTISKAKIEAAFIDGIQARVLNPKVLTEVARGFASELKSATKQDTDELPRLEAEIQRLRTETRRLVEAIAAGASPSMAEGIREREQQVVGLERRASDLRGLRKGAEVVPGPHQLRKLIADLAAQLLADLPQARRFIEEHVGKITLTPQTNGPKPYYVASGRFNFEGLTGGLSTSRKPPLVAGVGFEPTTFGL